MIDLIAIADVMAWALVHFIWQGAAIAAVVALALHALHNARPDDRYRIAGAGLVAMALAPVVTLGVLVGGGPPQSVVALPAEVAARPTSWTVALVAAWTLGVVIGLGRNGADLLTIELLRRRSIVAPPALQARFVALARRVGVRRVCLRLTPVGMSPLAIGWLRPAVLLPASLLLQLPAEQIEALLLHELAHVRRHDWIVNVAQAGVETLLFYHPAVHYLSRRMRHERELCCDAVAASTLCDPVVYARALTELHAAAHTPTLALAARGGVLMDRILRLIGRPSPARRPAWVWPTLAASTATALLAGAAAVASDPDLPDPLDAVASVSPDEDDRDDRDRDLTEPEDVGAKALELLASQLEKGANELKDSAAKLEAKADARQERRAERREERRGSPAAPDPAPERVRIGVRTHLDDNRGEIAALQAELHRLQAELDRERAAQDREQAEQERQMHMSYSGAHDAHDAHNAHDSHGAHDNDCETITAGTAQVVICGGETSVGVSGSNAWPHIEWDDTIAIAMVDDDVHVHTDRIVGRTQRHAERAAERAERKHQQHRVQAEALMHQAHTDAHRAVSEAHRRAEEVRRQAHAQAQEAAAAGWADGRFSSRRVRDPALVERLGAQAFEDRVEQIERAIEQAFDEAALEERIEWALERYEEHAEQAMEQYEDQAELWADGWEAWAEDLEDQLEDGHWDEIEWPAVPPAPMAPPAPPVPVFQGAAPLPPAPPAPPARVRARAPRSR